MRAHERAPGAGSTGGEDLAAAGSVSTLPPRPDKTLTFAQCLDLLELDDDELLSFGTSTKLGREFSGRQYRVGHLKAMNIDAYENHNVWCGLQPMRKASARGKNTDVLRIAALYADLDLDANKIPTVDAIRLVIDGLSAMLDTAPTYITFSGHGYQPVWKVDPDDSRDLDVMTPLLKGWGRLVKQVATVHGGSADSVFDPARILRVPDTTNWKNVHVPVDTWAAVTLP